ncbi:MAG: IPT/TIG domain-containing protein [Prevotellaceae bacterium]|jgi:hypothetical protein|nr:IPT/TIG domain-containing protein [Prevotellaceae bacterium]
MKHKNIMKRGGQLTLLACLLLLCMTRCKEEPADIGAQYNPDIPLEVARFTPDSGGAATQLMIYGSNFGTDTSKILLTVGGKKATLVGCNGSVIYAMVPRQVRPDSGFCELALRIEEQEVTCDQQFHYAPHYLVSTLAGFFSNENRDGSIVDGTFDKAGFELPYWLIFDEKKNLFLIERERALRYIDLEKGAVTTKFRTGNGMNRPRTLAFTPNFDTLLVAHDAGEWADMSQAMLTTADNFTDWERVCNSKQCNGGAFHPVHHDYYFNSYEAAQVYKVTDRSRIPWTYGELFRWGDKDWEFNIQFAPSGNFAYMVVINRHYIVRSNYNWTTRKLEAPTDFVGARWGWDHVDGMGTNARIDDPHQGAFDENDNFYLCEQGNHVIRKITPDGIVTTFAGRPRESGYVDGELRTAQFNRPTGIVYDRDTKTFYIADENNRRIRVITFE